MSDYSCGEWGPCVRGDIQTRSCALSFYSCRGNPPPIERQRSCDFYALLPLQMKANIDKWEGLHQEMIDGAKALVSQGIPGKEGISRINQVETRFLQEFNKYVGIYNSVLRLTVDQKKYWKGEGEIKSVEAKLAEIEKQFRAIPTVWY